jgi:hypothetical protein
MAMQRLRLTFVLPLVVFALLACASQPATSKPTLVPTANSHGAAPTAITTVAPTSITQSQEAPMATLAPMTATTADTAAPTVAATANLSLTAQMAAPVAKIVPPVTTGVVAPQPVLVKPQPDQTVPADLLQQMVWMPNMGGAGGDHCRGMTLQQPGKAEWGEKAASFDANLLTSEQLTITMRGAADWCACGFMRDAVQGELTLPDGSKRTVTVNQWEDPENSNSCGIVYLSPASTGIQLGPYKMTLQQGEQVLVDEFEIVLPSKLESVWLDENRAWFAGLGSHEQARLTLYGSRLDGASPQRHEFLGEQKVEADEHGVVLVEFDPELRDSYSFSAAIIDHAGQTTGVHTRDILGEDGAVFGKCGKALSSHLFGRKTAVVGEAGVLLTEQLYAGPALDTLGPGTKVTVTDGPFCDSYGNTWRWKVATEDGLEGWAPEVDAGTYYLQPGP